MKSILFRLLPVSVRTLFYTAFASICLLPSLPRAQSAEIPSLMIMADPSMTLALSEIARNYSRQHKTTVNTSFNNPKAHAQLIQEGAQADIFITASPKEIADLKLMGLVDVYSQAQLVGNALSLIGPSSSTLDIQLESGIALASALQQGDENFLFLLPDTESITEASTILEGLDKLKLKEDVKPYSFTYRDGHTLRKMVSQHGAYSVLFYTDALNLPDTRIISGIEKKYFSPITYQAVVVAGENMTPAREFMDYLKSGEALAVFIKYGFIQLEPTLPAANAPAVRN